MIFMSSLRDHAAADRKHPADWIEDHERKLFWAVWSLRLDKASPWKSIVSIVTYPPLKKPP